LDTLGTSIRSSGQNKHEPVYILQRAFVVADIVLFPVAISMAVLRTRFQALGQSLQLSHDSAKILSCLIPGWIGLYLFETMKKYLQARRSCARDIRYVESLTHQRHC